MLTRESVVDDVRGAFCYLFYFVFYLGSGDGGGKCAESLMRMIHHVDTTGRERSS
jgi:hypothetical protein